MTRHAALPLALLLLLGLGACGAGGALAPSGGGIAPSPSPAGGAAAMSAAELGLATNVLSLVNAERALVGLPPLAWSDCAAQAAYEHSQDMDIRNFFEHVNPDGHSPADRFQVCNIKFTAVGENIFRSNPSGTAAQAVAAWMNSPPHRANILSAAFTQLGVGVHEAGGQGWWTQFFYAP